MMQSLEPLIRRFGIQRTYHSAGGETVTSSDEAIRAVLDTLRGDHDTGEIGIIDPVLIAWNGRLKKLTLRLSPTAARRKIDYDIVLEAGDVVSGSIPLSSRTARRQHLTADVDIKLPVGYHELHLQTHDGQANATIFAAPRKCYAGDLERAWGVFAPMYSLRDADNKLIGDFADLQRLMQWVGLVGGDLAATLPISASFLRQPFDPSPYSPASRLFWNELYLHMDVPSAKSTELVDYRAAGETKRALLEPVVKEFFAQNMQNSSAFKAFRNLYPDVKDYAQFRAAGEKHESGWPAWPATARNGKLSPRDYDLSAVQYHMYAQFATHQQLSRLATSAGDTRLYLDLPLGVHPDSYDVWRNRELFVTGANAGAPPDPFFTKGQDWGFPPPNPVAIRADRYRYWRRVLQTQLRFAQILRLDHVMALHRLYFVPRGFEPSQGVYVGYPAEELYAVLTIESVRHQAAIVGEDLGTVPAEVRKSMAMHGVKRMFVVQFEATDDAERPMGEVPNEAVASLNTHDMPPFHAYWHMPGREQTIKALTPMFGAKDLSDVAKARTALLRFLADSPAELVLINLEDLWLETEPQNIPGTTTEHPNWRRRLRLTLDEIESDENVRKLIAMVDQARRS
jgi:4-alpha-glucanotransferase